MCLSSGLHIKTNVLTAWRKQTAVRPSGLFLWQCGTLSCDATYTLSAVDKLLNAVTVLQLQRTHQVAEPQPQPRQVQHPPLKRALLSLPLLKLSDLAHTSAYSAQQAPTLHLLMQPVLTLFAQEAPQAHLWLIPHVPVSQSCRGRLQVWSNIL